MDAARWRKIDEVFHAVAARPPAERAAVLAEACAGDAELRRYVEALLAGPMPAGFDTGGGLGMALAALSVAEGDRPALAGRRIGIYEIRERIGAGGMGEKLCRW